MTRSSVRVVAADGTEVFRPEEWAGRVAALRSFLRGRGVAPGDRVMAWLPRGWKEAALCQAVFDVGAVWVSIPRRNSPAQVAELFEDAGPRLAVCDDRDQTRLGGNWLEWSEWEKTVGDAPEAAEPGPGELAALCYTSGSTGRPKGVMVSHGNLRDAAVRVDEYLRHRESDRLLALMPLNAPWGLLQWMLACRAGASIVLPPAVAMGAEVARVVREAGVTGVAALPPTWVQLVDYLVSRGESLPELRYVTTSGGVVPARILELFPAAFPNAEVWMTYGLTEAFRTTVVPAREFASRKGSLGRPCPGVGIEILRADGTRAGTGEPGELVHTGACVTLGYWKRPEETRRAYAVRPDHEPVLGGGPVHYSGDVVRRDEDGYLWFEGRNDGLIKTGGYRVSPDEIEGCLLRVAGVLHAVAGGVPDEMLGQRIVAAIEVAGEAGAILETARAELRRSLGSHLQPQALHAWPGLMPLTANGKIDRPAVLAHLASM